MTPVTTAGRLHTSLAACTGAVCPVPEAGRFIKGGAAEDFCLRPAVSVYNNLAGFFNGPRKIEYGDVLVSTGVSKSEKRAVVSQSTLKGELKYKR